MYQMLPVFLDYPFLIVRRFSPVSYVPDVAGVSGLAFLVCPSVFSCVLCARCCRCFWIARRFSPVSYVPDVAGVSGLSIHDCSSVFSSVYIRYA
jgi:hypothetical protein